MTDMTDEFVKQSEIDEKTHPLSGSGWSHEEMTEYYRTLIKNMAINVDKHVDEAEFADVDGHLIVCEFINALLKTDPKRWEMFAKGGYYHNKTKTDH